jgi:hypothetical protein
MFSNVKQVEQIDGFKVTIKKEGFPGRMWYYQVEQGWHCCTGGPYNTAEEAHSAAVNAVRSLQSNGRA